MGVIKRGILGGFSGSVANVVGGSWKGIAYIRSKPLSVANPNTAGQQAQRTKWTAVVTAAQALLGTIVQTFWNPIAQGMSGFNRFIQTNIEAYDDSGNLIEADFKATIGSLTGLEGLSVAADASTNAIVVTWTDNTGTGSALATDRVGIAIYNVNSDSWTAVADAESRANETLTVEDTAMQVGDTLRCYVFAYRDGDASRCSTSDLSSTVVAA